MSSPRFLFAPVDADPARTLYVDGTVPGFRSLSHWPGNATPPALKRDLSTGIALAWAALPESERVRLTGRFDRLANNHYDTDGVLSAWIVLDPEAALTAEDLLLRTAATGDFGTWNGVDALALELTIMGLPDHPDSPVPVTPESGPDQRKAACYTWCFEHLPRLLADPFTHAAPWAERIDHVRRDIQRVDERDGVSVDTDPELSLALVVSGYTHTRLGLNRAAGDNNRVLLAREDASGTRCRFYDRVESWFELVTRRVPERMLLDELVAELNRRETGAGDNARWWCTPLDQPVAQLGFSDPALAGDGFSEDPSLDGFAPSRIPLAEIVELLRGSLAGPGAG
jgi:hypothetical protein